MRVVTGSDLLDLPSDNVGLLADASNKALDCVNAIVMRAQGKTP